MLTKRHILQSIRLLDQTRHRATRECLSDDGECAALRVYLDEQGRPRVQYLPEGEDSPI